MVLINFGLFYYISQIAKMQFLKCKLHRNFSQRSIAFAYQREHTPQEIELYPNLTVQECLEYMGDLAGDPKTERYYFPPM